MKPVLSPLILLDFSILSSNFQFIPAEGKKVNPENYFSKYELDLDFAIIDVNETNVFVKIDINNGEKKLPGYSIFAEGVAFFNLEDKTSLSEEDKFSLLNFSAFSIALNSLRGFVTSLTANAPWGKYTFPSIDVNDIFKQKMEESNEEEELPEN